jgi:hypothetical protein
MGRAWAFGVQGFGFEPRSGSMEIREIAQEVAEKYGIENADILEGGTYTTEQWKELIPHYARWMCFGNEEDLRGYIEQKAKFLTASK